MVLSPFYLKIYFVKGCKLNNEVPLLSPLMLRLSPSLCAVSWSREFRTTLQYVQLNPVNAARGTFPIIYKKMHQYGEPKLLFKLEQGYWYQSSLKQNITQNSEGRYLDVPVLKPGCVPCLDL